MFKLYYFPGACSLAPHLALEELEIPFEGIRLDPAKGDLDSPDFLAINPNGAVPVLVLENGNALTEVAVILQYLADLKPEQGLLAPTPSMDRYRTLEKLNFIATELHKGFGPIFSPEDLADQSEAISQVRTHGEATLRLRLGIAESWFSDGRIYTMGEQVTIADFYLQVILLWSKPTKLDISGFPKLVAFSERMRERANTQRAYKTEFARAKG